MAKIVTDTITITFSKLVKDEVDNNSVLDSKQIENLLEQLEEAVTALISDDTVVVEVG